jgi:membrane-associated protease RseP (regulator of RpoE activity)
MIRSPSIAALAALCLTTWGAGASFAREGLSTPPGPAGLTVTGVVPGSTAAQQGIEVGDVIVSVDRQPVNRTPDLYLHLSRAGQVATLEVIDGRTGGQNLVRVRPRSGRIGVDVRPGGWEYRSATEPLWPNDTLPEWGMHLLPQPVNPWNNPWNWGPYPLPWPPPGALPGR